MSRVRFELPAGVVSAPSFEMALQSIPHGDSSEYPGVREVAKFDTPKGLYSGCCTCGWKSEGLGDEKGAWGAARAHHAAKHPRG